MNKNPSFHIFFQKTPLSPSLFLNSIFYIKCARSFTGQKEKTAYNNPNMLVSFERVSVRFKNSLSDLKGYLSDLKKDCLV